MKIQKCAAFSGGDVDGKPVEISFSLRHPLPADYIALASWIPDARACARWAGSRLGFPFTAADLPGLLSDVGGYSYSLIDGDGGILGFGQHWAPKPGAVHLGRIILSPGYRGKGYGHHLCKLLIDRAIEVTQVSTVTLRVYRDNAVAISLYTSLGFSEQEEESTQELLFMRLGINSVREGTFYDQESAHNP